MRIAIIGAGNVGGVLGKAWAATHTVVFGVRQPGSEKAQAVARAAGSNVGVASVAGAAEGAEVVVLATPWPATESAIRDAGNLAGKIVIDCTNPLSDDFSGLTVGHSDSGLEQVARWATGAKVYKALNQVGFNIMSGPQLAGRRAVQFVCGDDGPEKEVVVRLVAELGFEVADAGGPTAARLLEPFAMLWIHMAYARGMGRDFAFGLLRGADDDQTGSAIP